MANAVKIPWRPMRKRHEMPTDEAMADINRMVNLECTLAYEYAVSVLESNSGAAQDDSGEWLDLGSPSGDDLESLTREAIEYLDWRGLLEWHATEPDWVQVLDEDAVEVSVVAR